MAHYSIVTQFLVIGYFSYFMDEKTEAQSDSEFLSQSYNTLCLSHFST